MHPSELNWITNAEADTLLLEVLDPVHQILVAAAPAIQLPHDQCIP